MMNAVYISFLLVVKLDYFGVFISKDISKDRVNIPKIGLDFLSAKKIDKKASYSNISELCCIRTS